MGFPPGEFWDQTPASFGAVMRGARIRLRREGERDIALAHTSAAFGRAKKLEKLDRYLPKRVPTGTAPKRSMLDRLKAIAAQTAGGRITNRGASIPD